LAPLPSTSETSKTLVATSGTTNLEGTTDMMDHLAKTIAITSNSKEDSTAGSVEKLATMLGNVKPKPMPRLLLPTLSIAKSTQSPSKTITNRGMPSQLSSKINLTQQTNRNFEPGLTRREPP
jgi:hypothetical protein